MLAETSARMASIHPVYDTIASHIEASRIHKTTPRRFSSVVEGFSVDSESLFNILSLYIDVAVGMSETTISPVVYQAVRAYTGRIDSAIVHGRDYAFSL